MQLGFEVHYLRIDWLAEGVTSKIEVAPTPLAVEQFGTREFTVESTIFNDSYPWIGIRIDDQEKVLPAMVDASGRETPWLRVNNPVGEGVWFISSDGWDGSTQRHLSELRRSSGSFRVRIGDRFLVIQNSLSGYGRGDIQAYVDDFRGSLLWMIMNDEAGATATGGAGTSSAQLVPILDALCTAARKILATPLVAVKEGRRPTPISKVRATAETFRELSQQPQKRRLTGRVFDESANTAENRYVRHMLALVNAWISAWLKAASRQSEFLGALSTQEDQRAKDNRVMTHRHVDPDVYDQQTADIARRVNALTNYRAGGSVRPPRTREYPIRLTQRFGDGPSYFYDRVDGRAAASDEDIAFRVVVLPEQIFNLVQSSIHVCRELTFEGEASSVIKETQRGKKYRELSFSMVSSISIRTDPTAARIAKRRFLEEHGWTVGLTSAERKELQREAKTAESRARRALSKRNAIASSAEALGRSAGTLAEIDSRLRGLGVTRSDVFPTGMTFVTNPAYSACLSSFKMVAELFRKVGFDPSLLEDVEKVGILHASDIYEKWCLLQLFAILIEDFRFTPESNWASRLVAASVSGERNLAFEFYRHDIGQRVTLIYQFESIAGRRPDFIIRFFDVLNAHQEPRGVVVLDSKFRSTWGSRSPRQLLDELIQTKGYDKIGSVFILQPCDGTVRDNASPLEWGRHCDYGATQSHTHGWIQLGLSSSGATATDHLKRLLIMGFQSVFPEPEDVDGEQQEWESRSFCLGCGEAHARQSIRSKQTKGGGTSWLLDCALCGVWTIRTHCYHCRKVLFKNGTRWTYHLTLADQVTNVICPVCGSHFDRRPAYGE